MTERYDDIDLFELEQRHGDAVAHRSLDP